MKTYLKYTLFLVLPVIIVTATSCKKEKEDTVSVGKSLYFNCWNDSTVNKIDFAADSFNYTTLFDKSDGIISPSGITLTSDGYLIISEFYANQILKMKKDGSGTPQVIYDLADGVAWPTAITIDNSTGTIYWANTSDGKIMKGKADGSVAPVGMFGGASLIYQCYGIAIDPANNKIYTCDFAHTYIMVGNLNGSGTLSALWDDSNFPDIGAPSNIFVEPSKNKIYWTDEWKDMVVVANLDGTGTPSVLFDDTDGVSRADGIYVDRAGGKIYWSETNNYTICKGNLDGTGTREIMIDDVETYHLILGF
jgi:DNA-binding beta-propeller fold protein YncE